jgi:ABC-type transport system substrate-binding protein
MERDYWRRAVDRRLTRRRVLTITGSSATAALLLAACGGSESESKPAADKSSLVQKPVDTSKSAKHGGILKASVTQDVNRFDPHITDITNRGPALWGFSRLTVAKPGYLDNPNGEIAPDLAESWELSPDKLQLTMKLRTGARFAPPAPVNGRPVDSDDVLFSWTRFIGIGTERIKFANSLSPEAPVLSLSAPDSRTVVFKLNHPTASLLASLANSNNGNFFIVPKEAGSGLDINKTPIGSGPFYLAEHQPSVRLTFKRNPGFYDKDRPYFDTIEWPIIPEYAAGLAQFVAGAVFTFGVRADDILTTKKQVPDLVMLQTEVSPTLVRSYYGMRPGQPDKSPYKDERVRQAFSMSWDRDLFIDVMNNVDKLRAEGIDLETRWSSALRANEFEGWWLDPRGKDFGPNAKYYQRNLAEAKRLLAAAGFANGFEVDTPVTATSPGAVNFEKQVQLIAGMAEEAGMRLKVSNIEPIEATNRFSQTNGNFEGITFRVPGIGGFVDICEKLYAEFNSKGGPIFMGFDVNGSGSRTGDPMTDDLTSKMRTEFDTKKRIALTHDLQRYNGQKQYSTILPGGAAGLSLAWPVVQNRFVYRTGLHWPANHFEWLDETKPPLKKPA